VSAAEVIRRIFRLAAAERQSCRGSHERRHLRENQMR